MPAKVFVSCGQATDQERTMATEVAEWFKTEGYTAYVATEVQTISELNSQIVYELKSSDYYLFINLARETISSPDPLPASFRRGSVYTNQELAVAYAYGFDKPILLNQKDVRKEGILSYITINTKEFDSINDVPKAVKEAVKKSGWENTFSRHLEVYDDDVQLDGPVPYRDHTIGWSGQPFSIAHLNVRNNRPDIAAINCAARLIEIQQSGSPARPSPDQGRLKAMLRHGYEQSIWPRSTGAFDLFGIHDTYYPMTYLLSELDVTPRQPIIQTLGTYALTYEIYSTGFPKLTVQVELNLPPLPANPTTKMVEVSSTR
jgi:hypothetical protein